MELFKSTIIFYSCIKNNGILTTQKLLYLSKYSGMCGEALETNTDCLHRYIYLTESLWTFVHEFTLLRNMLKIQLIYHSWIEANIQKCRVLYKWVIQKFIFEATPKRVKKVLMTTQMSSGSMKFQIWAAPCLLCQVPLVQRMWSSLRGCWHSTSVTPSGGAMSSIRSDSDG